MSFMSYTYIIWVDPSYITPNLRKTTQRVIYDAVLTWHVE